MSIFNQNHNLCLNLTEGLSRLEPTTDAMQAVNPGFNVKVLILSLRLLCRMRMLNRASERNPCSNYSMFPSWRSKLWTKFLQDGFEMQSTHSERSGCLSNRGCKLIISLYSLKRELLLVLEPLSCSPGMSLIMAEFGYRHLLWTY